MSFNPERGEVAVTIAGEELVLRPSFDAMVKIKTKTGLALGYDLLRSLVQLDAVTISIVIGECARAAGSKLSDGQVFERMTGAGDVANLASGLGDLFTNMLTGGMKPKGEAEAADQPK